MKTILFVCYGNTHRSPMAASLLQARVRDRARVVSAGTHAGSAVSKAAVDAMRDIGIDISGHRPRQLTKDICAAADIIICMDQEVAEEVYQVLGTSDPPVEYWGIPDPYNPAVDIVHVRDTIRSRVAELAGRLGL